MSQTGVLYIPDAIAMLVLMGVLLYLRVRSHAGDATFWLIGLSFILVEDVAAGTYRSGPILHEVMHTVALSAYIFAGFTFAWASRGQRILQKRYLLFSLAWMVPLLALAALYGSGSKRAASYTAVLVAAFAAQAFYAVFFRNRSRTLSLAALLQLPEWGVMLWLAHRGQFRGAVYWGLACLYLAVAIVLRSMLKRSKLGGGIVIAGFAVWSTCLFLHPYAVANSLSAVLLDQVWTLQKFFVTIGLLLVLLDEERSHSLTMALYDSLTGLPNRRLLDDRLTQAMHLADRTGGSFALFVVDLNGFKAINDEFGHEEGDRVLCQASERLTSALGSSDTLARWGGDEFTIVAGDLRSSAACEQLRQALLASLNNSALDTVAPLSGSIGFALYPGDATDKKLLRSIADSRMYSDKRRPLARASAVLGANATA